MTCDKSSLKQQAVSCFHLKEGKLDPVLYELQYKVQVLARTVSFGPSVLSRIRREKAAGALLYYYLQLRSYFNISA